jgi:prevent-host-death family protein
VKRIGIADLKAHLSAHLEAVQRGESLIVVDRNTPIARLVPFVEGGNGLTVRHALRELHSVELPPPIRRETNSLAVLLEERQRDR